MHAHARIHTHSTHTIIDIKRTHTLHRRMMRSPIKNGHTWPWEERAADSSPVTLTDTSLPEPLPVPLPKAM